MAAAAAAAQDAPKPVGDTFRLNFGIHELDQGKRVNTRVYTMLVENGTSGQVRVGTKLAISTSPGNLQYLDVGTSLDCRLEEQNSRVTLEVNADFSNVETGPQAPSPGPSIRQVRSHTKSEVTPGTPTRLAMLDDPVSRHSYEIEVTATRIK